MPDKCRQLVKCEKVAINMHYFPLVVNSLVKLNVAQPRAFQNIKAIRFLKSLENNCIFLYISPHNTLTRTSPRNHHLFNTVQVCNSVVKLHFYYYYHLSCYVYTKACPWVYLVRLALYFLLIMYSDHKCGSINKQPYWVPSNRCRKIGDVGVKQCRRRAARTLQTIVRI